MAWSQWGGPQMQGLMAAVNPTPQVAGPPPMAAAPPVVAAALAAQQVAGAPMAIPAGYTAEQYQQLQQQNWQQWAQWQQQYQQWHQQYGEQYQKLAATGAVPPVANMMGAAGAAPPLPAAAPPLPKENPPPLPPEEPPKQSGQPPQPQQPSRQPAQPSQPQSQFPNHPQKAQNFRDQPRGGQPPSQYGGQPPSQYGGQPPSQYGGQPPSQYGGQPPYGGQAHSREPPYGGQAHGREPPYGGQAHGREPPYGREPLQNANKRPFNQGHDRDGAKRQQTSQGNWNAPSQNRGLPPNQLQDKPPVPTVNHAKKLEELSEAEKKFDKEFAAWESQFNTWREQNASHPDKTQYREYEKKWESWRNSLLERREQMRKKREALQAAIDAANKPVVAPPVIPPTQPLLTTRPPPIIPATKPPILPDIPPQPIVEKPLDILSKPPPTQNNEPLSFKPAKKFPGEEVVETVEDGDAFLKTSGGYDGIPGLDFSNDGEHGRGNEGELPPPKGNEPQRGPDLDAISKGINTILADPKLLNMLSMVSQNQSMGNPVLTNTTSALPATLLSARASGPISSHYEQSNQSFDEFHDGRRPPREAVNNFDDQTRMSFTNGPNDDMGYGNETNFGRGPPSAGFGKRPIDNFNRFGGPPPDSEPFGGRQQFDRFGRGDGPDKSFGSRGPPLINQDRFGNRDNFNRDGNRDFGRDNGPPPNREFNRFGRDDGNFNKFGDNKKGGGGNIRNDRFQHDNYKRGFDNRGGYGENQYQKGGFDDDWNEEEDYDRFHNRFSQDEEMHNQEKINQREQEFRFDPPPRHNQSGFQGKPPYPPQGQSSLLPDPPKPASNAIPSLLQMPLIEPPRFEPPTSQGPPTMTQDLPPMSQAPPSMAQAPPAMPIVEPPLENFPIDEPVHEVPPVEEIPPAPIEEDFFVPEVVVDYEHKSLKPPEPEISLEPIYTFDYRNKQVSRIPYPQRPKWLFDTVKNIRQFDPLGATRFAFEPPVGNDRYDQRPTPFLEQRAPAPFDRDNGRYPPEDRGRPPPDDRGRHPIHFERRPPGHDRSEKRPTNNRYERRRSNDRDLGRSRSRDRFNNRDDRDKNRFDDRRRDRDADRGGHGRFENDKRWSRDRKSPERGARHGGPAPAQRDDFEDLSDGDFDDDNKASKAFSPPRPLHEQLERISPEPTFDPVPRNNAFAVKKYEPSVIEDLIYPPGRHNRPARIVIILRGPPGSGKTFLAKLIKDKEVENGGSAPRILSLDDYFMVEQEAQVMEEGVMVNVKQMKYEYEAEMEASYRQSLIKAFKKTITDGYFPFIVVDNINEKVRYFGEMWSFAKKNGFQVYICQMDLDPEQCTRRNIHNRSKRDIENYISSWEPTPQHHPTIDATGFLQNAIPIQEVDMEIDDAQEDDGEDKEVMEVESSSKWDSFDCSENNLARLDGVNKRLKPSHSMEEYLQLEDEWQESTEPLAPGKKRVRWADLEEQKQQKKMRALGFVVGQTDWNRITDQSEGQNALRQTKYIERVKKT